MFITPVMNTDQSWCFLASQLGLLCVFQRFSNFFDYGPLFSSGIVGGPPTLVTVKFTAKYSNSWVHCFSQTNQNHQLYLQITMEGKQC